MVGGTRDAFIVQRYLSSSLDIIVFRTLRLFLSSPFCILDNGKPLQKEPKGMNMIFHHVFVTFDALGMD